MKVRGVQAKQVSVSFITLSKNASGTRRRAPEDREESVRRAPFGISQSQLKNDTVQQAIGQVAGRPERYLKDPADRAALAQQLFGRAGAPGAHPRPGRRGRRASMTPAREHPRNSARICRTTPKQFSDAVDTQRKFGLALDGLKIAFTTAVLPLLISAADAVHEVRRADPVQGRAPAASSRPMRSRAFGIGENPPSVMSSPRSAG